MEITFDSDEYISTEDKRQIALDAFRIVAASKSKEDFERILTNAGYHLVEAEVNKAFNGDMATVILEKSLEVVRKLSEFTVFKKPNAWDREESKGWTHLQMAMDAAQPLIAKRVNEIVEAMDADFLHDLIQQQIAVAIIEKLTTKAVTNVP